MKSGAIVLLLGLLALWAQLPPAAGGPLYIPADPRSCYAMIPHWFYNWQAKKCENFMYGGCDGDEETQTDCLGKCGGHGEAGGWAAPSPAGEFGKMAGALGLSSTP
ncbi:hypothetical protein G0U57_004255 [Chelydra serpentina]|uniref:BPTI/Kunitz inhibitor domain-containing protein n=1 Tax=Chelydra serpentina TaxID=8475 RepID=A0A8T1SNK8_CHESE|nr:hypothetical protein G0U57_004255 [Chelydra serpentina]